MINMLPYPSNRLKLVRHATPLVCLQRLSDELGGPRIWIKRDDLTGCAASGNKIRKLEFSLGEAVSRGADTVITCGGLQSNHCRVTALLCAELGLECHLILRGEKPKQLQGNTYLDQLLGAHIHYYPVVSEYQQHLPEIIETLEQELTQQNKTPFVIPTGASDEIGLWGYIAGFEELYHACQANNLQPDAIIHATGSGGTQAGLIAGQWFLQQNIPVWGVNVCDSKQHFVDKITDDITAWSSRYQIENQLTESQIHVLEGYMGSGYAKSYPELEATIKKVARLEGIILDPVYTGKAFHGMIEEIKSGQFSAMDNVVFIHTGGIFGLFPYQELVC